MKRSLLILLLLTVSAALILLSLDRLMGNSGRSLNGFSREFIEKKMSMSNEFELDKSYYNISGWNDDKIYLQTIKAGEILELDISANTIKDAKIDIPAVDKLEPAFITSVKYPMIYITGTNARKLIRGNFKTNKVDVFDLSTGPVLSTEVTDDENAIIRYIDTNTYQLKFGKINFVRNEVASSVNVSQVNSEDIFAYDGKLNRDNKTGKFCYVNFYCNGITSFDSSLNLTRFNSIDTMTVPKVTIAHLESSITHKKPPVAVNKGSFVYNGRVYVNSALAADNEEVLEGNTVIDVYGPEYEGSFHVPVPAGEFVQAEFLDDKRMAVLLKDRLIIFNTSSLLQ